MTPDTLTVVITLPNRAWPWGMSVLVSNYKITLSVCHMCIAVYCELLLRISPTPPNNIQPCHCSKNFVTVQNKNFEKWLIPLLDFTSLRKMKILRVFSQQLGFHSYPERWWCRSDHLSTSARMEICGLSLSISFSNHSPSSLSWAKYL